MDVQEQQNRVQVAGPPDPASLQGLPAGNIQPIIFYPNSALRESSDDVPLDAWDDADITGLLHQTIADLITTMYATGGIGLSAPQIGIGSRIFACDPMANVRPEPGKPLPSSGLLVAINPEVMPIGAEKVQEQEGCLSFPGINESIGRPAKIRFRARDKDGKLYAFQTGGILARIIQHENDHLDGILMLDHMGQLSRSYTVRRMRNLRRTVLRDGVGKKKGKS